jgi:ribonuclease R
LITESKEYYEGKIDMTGRKTAYFVCRIRGRCFIPTNNLNALDKDIVKVYV